MLEWHEDPAAFKLIGRILKEHGLEAIGCDDEGKVVIVQFAKAGFLDRSDGCLVQPKQSAPRGVNLEAFIRGWVEEQLDSLLNRTITKADLCLEDIKNDPMKFVERYLLDPQPIPQFLCVDPGAPGGDRTAIAIANKRMDDHVLMILDEASYFPEEIWNPEAGGIRWMPCDTCGGTGEVTGMVCYGGPPVERDDLPCPDCNPLDGASPQNRHEPQWSEETLASLRKEIQNCEHCRDYGNNPCDKHKAHSFNRIRVQGSWMDQ